MAQSAIPVRPFIAQMDPVARQFIQTGRAVIGHPVSALIPPVIAGLERLIADPARDRWMLKIERPGESDEDPDDGLVRKQDGTSKKREDNKYFFHHRFTLEANLAARGVDTSMHRDLLRACDALHAECRAISHEFGAAFDRVYPGYDLLDRLIDAEAMDLDPLRILSYDTGNEIGKAHTDKNAFTFHIAESRGGLRIGPEKTPYVALPDRILIFPGDKLGRLTGGKITPLVHDIVDSETHASTGRWSLIYFAHMLWSSIGGR